jgi:small GTP-binding protein
MSNAAYKFKIVMLGDFAVGKTSLVKRFVYDAFDDMYLTTLGVKVTKNEIQLVDNGNHVGVMLLLWDIGGHSRFSEISMNYLKGAGGAIIVGDLSNADTMKHIPNHLAIFREVNPGGRFLVALNKADLVDADKTGYDYVKKFLDHPDSYPDDVFSLTSAKTGANVEALFHTMASQLMREGK